MWSERLEHIEKHKNNFKDEVVVGENPGSKYDKALTNSSDI